MPWPKPNKLHDELDALLDGRPIELTDELAPLAEAADQLRVELAGLRLDPEVADRHLERVLHGSAAGVRLPVRSQASGWDVRRRVVAVALAAALVLAPATMASAAALPGQAMYPFKRAIEHLPLASVQWSPAREAGERTRVASERLSEVRHLYDLEMYSQLPTAIRAPNQAVVEAPIAVQEAGQQGEPVPGVELRLGQVVAAGVQVVQKVAIAAGAGTIGLSGDTAREIQAAVQQSPAVQPQPADPAPPPGGGTGTPTQTTSAPAASQGPVTTTPPTPSTEPPTTAEPPTTQPPPTTNPPPPPARPPPPPPAPPPPAEPPTTQPPDVTATVGSIGVDPGDIGGYAAPAGAAAPGDAPPSRPPPDPPPLTAVAIRGAPPARTRGNPPCWSHSPAVSAPPSSCVGCCASTTPATCWSSATPATTCACTGWPSRPTWTRSPTPWPGWPTRGGAGSWPARPGTSATPWCGWASRAGSPSATATSPPTCCGPGCWPRASACRRPRPRSAGA